MKSPRIWIPLLVLVIGCSWSLAAWAQAAPADSSAAMHSAGKAGMTHMKKAPAKHRELIDINSASKEDLMKLPGIGEKTAEKIIDGRPYASKVQLRSKKVVTRAEYAKISARITAKAAAAEK
jgi:DNA uptake protein ComE-like DNA-binding protein